MVGPRFPSRDPQLMFELARDRLSLQLASVDAADTKLLGLASWSTAGPAVLAAVLALRPQYFHGLEIAALALVVAAYIAEATLAVRALWGKNWRNGPGLLALWNDHFTELSEQELRWNVARDLWDYFDQNAPMYRCKMRSIRAVLLLVMLETAGLVIGLVLVAVGA